MNLIKRIYLFFLFHQHNYRKILKITAFDENQKISSINSLALKYQAYASFYLKNYHHSQFCFEILKERNEITPKGCNLLAYMYARHNDRDKAISSWCLALEKNKGNVIAKSALDYIREQGREINLIEDEYFDTIIPAEPFLLPFRIVGKIFLILLVIFLLSSLLVFSVVKIKKQIKLNKINSREEINKISLPDFNPNLLENAKEEAKKYSYTEREIKQKFDRIKQNILDNRAIDAQKEINQIRLSNASLAVKFKMDILEDFINEPDYSSFKNEVTYEDFLKEKELYNNVYIMWYGKVVNLSINKERILFDFILGDEKEGIITGIIPVVFSKAVVLDNNDKVIVFGKLKYARDADIFVKGLYVIKNVGLEQ